MGLVECRISVFCYRMWDDRVFEGGMQNGYEDWEAGT